MKWSIKNELGSLSVIAAMLLASAVSWSRAPERLPVHWNLGGEVDRWGGRTEALLALPAIALGVYLLLLLLPRLDPGRANYQRFAGAYRLLRLGVLLLLAVIHAIVLAPIYGITPHVNRVLPFAGGLLLVLTGATMGKLRPNWFVGIRTPWTLSSKLSWTRTHRLGGWLFIGAGLLAMAASVAVPHRGTAVLVGGVLVVAAVAIVYSYLVWRTDPDRLAPAGTSPAEEETP
jgi:uncharacterized membrane protein